MYVIKRSGLKEEVNPDKLTRRIKNVCYGLNMDFIDPHAITLRVINGLYSGVKTVEINNLAAEITATMTTLHPDFSTLAARILISNLYKENTKTFSEVMNDLYNAIDPITTKHKPIISEEYNNIIQKYKDILNSTIKYSRDFNYTYFGFKTMEKSYLFRINGKVVERPQDMLMRVAIAIHKEDLEKVIETYNYTSQCYFTHASPTLFFACTTYQQMSSCFILDMIEDSIEGIFETLKRCAIISKFTGGIGLNVHNVRAKGTPISGNGGVSNGLVPMIRVFNNTAHFIDQGGNKRPGAFAIYLEPWHAEIFEFLDLKKNIGKEENRARELFYALWIPDLFMQRVLDDKIWSLMCPHQCPGLSDVWGEDFNKLYTKYEEEKRYKHQVIARNLWNAILKAQVETGTPFMLYKDHCNRKSNQQNLGTIKSSNLCTEIIQYSSPDEIAVCNLASIAVNMFVDNNTNSYNFVKLKEVVKVVTKNLDKIIDINYYPLIQAEKSNLTHRPIGIGIQGLADAFLLMRYPFESEEAQKLNVQIFETLYYGALEASCELAQEKGPYTSYEGSPISKGVLQYDMWNVTPTNLWDWIALKINIAKYGVRNSLLVAPMPTASTAQILGNNESIEPYTSNIYTRRVLSGEFMIVNPHLLKDLINKNLWNEEMKNEIIANNGSIQSIEQIPQYMKELYKTVWEISQKNVLKMAADRGPFIDQSQSINVYMAKPTIEKLTSMHFYGWKAGLKTGMYYLRTKPAANALQFTVNKSLLKSYLIQQTDKRSNTAMQNKKKDEDNTCIMCNN